MLYCSITSHSYYFQYPLYYGHDYSPVFNTDNCVGTHPAMDWWFTTFSILTDTEGPESTLARFMSL